MTVVARVLASAGAVLVVTAATVGIAFFGARSWLTLMPLVAGAAGVTLGVDLGRGERSDAWRERARIVAEISAVLAIAGVLLWGISRVDLSVDVTSARKNTLSEASVATAAALAKDVVITATLDRRDRAAIELDELVSRYRRHTERITLRIVNPKDDPAAARDAPVVVSAGDRRRKVRFEVGAPDQEEQLTKALRAVTSEHRPRVYVLAGHGEREIVDDSGGGLSQFARALTDEGLEVVPFPLAAVGTIPEDVRVLVIASPTTSMAKAEIDAISKFVDGGGRAMILLEPAADPFLAPILAARGVQINDDIVIDGSAFAGLLGGADATAGVAYAQHPVTSKLGSAMTHFVRARSLAENPGTPAKYTALVQSGVEAWGETQWKPGQKPTRDASDIAGPLTLLAAVEEESGGRLIVGGDVTFISNEGIGLGANRDLALNAMLWLAAREDQIVIRPRGRGGNLLLLTPSARERVAFVLLYGIPMFLVVVGVALRAARRAR